MREAVLGSIILGMLFVPGAALSDSVLWDLIIQAHIDEEPVIPGHAPTVSGQVVDHAGKPIRGADIAISAGSLSFDTVTGENGDFQQELAGFDEIPGTYAASIRAGHEDKLGAAHLEFHVSGEIRQSEILARQLGTATAQKYLHADEGEFSNDVIGMRAYQYYQGLYEEYLDALEGEGREAGADEIERQREAAYQLLQEAMIEKDIGAGVYQGWGYKRFVDNLDRSVRDIIVGQLNHTKASFYEAQQIMDGILENGGSHQEARDAYLDRLSVTQEVMAGLTTMHGAIRADATDAGPPAEAKAGTGDAETPVAEDPHTPSTNGTSIEVETSGNSIFINIDGVVTEFIINGTQLVKVANSTG